MILQLLDIGGSGVKAVKILDVCDINHHLHVTLLERGIKNLKYLDVSDALNHYKISHYSNVDWNNFAQWASRKGLLDADLIGISCAGFILPDKKVELFSTGGWHNKEIVKEIHEYKPHSKVFLINDAEAHLMAHDGLNQNPTMSISLGTSLGFAISNNNGEIMRSLNGINYDLGEMILPTRAENNKVWWALGSSGLQSLQKTYGNIEGTKHFGSRLGSFLITLCSIFRPTSIVFSGGITASCWEAFKVPMETEFNTQKPSWLNSVTFSKSPYSDNAALIGIGNYVKKHF